MHVHRSQNHDGDFLPWECKFRLFEDSLIFARIIMMIFYHGNVSSDRHVGVGEDVRGGERAKLRGGVELPSGHFVISMRLFCQNYFVGYFSSS